MFIDNKINNVNIKYNTISAIKNIFACLNKLNLFYKILCFILIYIHQTFYKKKTIVLKYNENEIFSSKSFRFGEPFHYNYFQIDNLHINRYLNSISKTLHCISVLGSKHKLLDSISADILNNITNILSYD
jgi:hypothetical protein